jgi:hypothetical protein
MAAPKTGVTAASILKVNKVVIVTKGIKTLLVLKPGIANVLLVINKFTKVIVLLTPIKTTPKIKISCEPTPVNFVLEEKGVIKVQPAVVKVRLEHFVNVTFCLLDLTTRLAAYQKFSGY